MIVSLSLSSAYLQHVSGVAPHQSRQQPLLTNIPWLSLHIHRENEGILNLVVGSYPDEATPPVKRHAPAVKPTSPPEAEEEEEPFEPQPLKVALEDGSYKTIRYEKDTTGEVSLFAWEKDGSRR